MASPARPPDPAAGRAGAVLTVDLDAVQANYRRLKQELGDVACAGAVKADAYGLGMARVAPALAAVGARCFFVALPDEVQAGVWAERVAPHLRDDAIVGFLHGFNVHYELIRPPAKVATTRPSGFWLTT